MIEKIGHYSLTSPASVYDEEALTALELVGRIAAKANECVEVVNTMERELPDKVDNTAKDYLENGGFDKTLDGYAGRLFDQLSQVNKQLTARIDNVLGGIPEGGTSMDAEVIDARLDAFGKTHPNAGTAIRSQMVDAIRAYTGFVYFSSTQQLEIDKSSTDGSIKVYFGGRATRRTARSQGTIDWAPAVTELGNRFEPDPTSDKKGTVTIPAYTSLVYNELTEKYHFRQNGACQAYDLLMIQNAYCNPIRGSLLDEWQMKELEKQNATMWKMQGGYIYHGSSGDMVFTPNPADNTLDVYFIGRPTVCWGSTSKLIDWNDANLADIKNYVTVESSTRATIKIPSWSALVYNIHDAKWHFRSRANTLDGDIVALAVGYYQPLWGTMLTEWNNRRINELLEGIEADSLIGSPPDAVKSYNALHNSVGEKESFVFFTDPHLARKSTFNWWTNLAQHTKYIKTVFDSTPASFVVCGGDWLGNSDTMNEAIMKLSYIDKTMKGLFPGKYYPVLGNHDTNYQGIVMEGAETGSGKLTNDLIHKLWFKEYANTYYEFKGDNTRFLVFNSGLDTDAHYLKEFDIEQINWAADKLIASPAEHNAFVLHIGCMNESTTEGVMAMAFDLSKMANAYNNRTTYTLGDRTFNFTSATGKVHFILSGHRHDDGIATVNNIPLVVTTQTVESDNATTFELCMVDYTTNKLHLVRSGSGESVRVIDI